MSGPAWAREALAACADGRLAPEMALVRLIMAAPDEAACAALLAEAGGGRPAGGIARLAALAAAHPAAFRTVRAAVAAVPHHLPAAGDPFAEVARWAARFDAAAAVSPEAGVALYSLGDPGTLAAATGELVAALSRHGLVDPGSDLLDVGCGIGRLETALAGRVRRIIGIDVSQAMAQGARERTEGLPGVEIRLASGLDLQDFADGSFDGVVMVDAMPYMVASGGGLAARMVAEAARVLRPGGRLAVANVSYRDDAAADRADLAAWGEAAGLVVLACGEPVPGRWDGLLFVLARPGRQDAEGPARGRRPFLSSVWLRHLAR